MNRLWRTIILGLRSLRLHLLRSTLTILGIMFGVFSVVAMLAIGEGASYEAQEQIKSLGSTNIILKSVQPIENKEAGDGNQRSVRYGLRYNDASQIQATIPKVSVMVAARDYPKEVAFETRLANATVRGTVPWFPKVANLKMMKGTFLTDLHERDHSNVCVLTPEIARRLFLYIYPIGRVIKIGLEPFTVVGIIQTKTGLVKDGAETPTNINTIYVPMSTSRIIFGEEIVTRTSGSFRREDIQLHEVQIRVAEPEDVRPVAASLRTLLKKNHKNNDYEIIVPLELLQQAKETKRIFNIVLGAIAGISLLVGGIGIMNIMLASVTERTREIGIRRALGAQKRHIVLQFLVETVVLSSLGGLIGVALGLLAPFLVTRFFGLTTIVLPEFIALSFGISGLVGVLFGIYPAVRAAGMDPIEALRHE